MLADWIKEIATSIANRVPDGTMLSMSVMVYALFALVLIGLVCGGVGSLVVGNRMAFFSDALAHCAFAGVALALLLGIATSAAENTVRALITPIMVVFGILMGSLIALVRDRTSQSSDTVIGVFFAAAIGIGAIFLKAGASRRYLPSEEFLFGALTDLNSHVVAELLLVTLVVGFGLVLLYNQLVLASFNPSLARSRGVHVRLCNYLFIVLLAVIVNVCLRAVGVLLINGLLIVPAATAANLSKNMRQLFALSMALCILCGVGGLWLSWEIANRTEFTPGESGTIVVLAVLLYFLSMLISPLLRRHRDKHDADAGRPASTPQLAGGGEPTA